MLLLFLSSYNVPNQQEISMIHTIPKRCFLVLKTLLFLTLTVVLTAATTAEVAAQAKVFNADGQELNISNTVQTVAEVDSLALVAFYNSMRGDTWLDNTGWLVDPVAFWHGITRINEIELPSGDREFRVTRMEVFPNDNNMTRCGYLPPELSDLEYLQFLEMGRQFVCGEIPAEIFDLEFLVRLRLRGSFLTGEIPWDAIANATSLARLELEQNELEGPVMTPAIANNQRLARITLDENIRLTGSIPNEILQLENLERFGADGLINISGPMPDFSQLPSLEVLEIQFSNFDPGPFPSWVQNMGGSDGIERLALHETNIQGEIPQWIIELTNVSELKLGGTGMGMDMANFPNMSFLPALRRFRIWGGNFTGELPSWFGDMDLERLWISYTDIGGDLPGDVFQNLTSLTLLKMRHNQFTGGLPPQIQSISGLDYLAFEYNQMEIGDIPDWIGQNLTGLSKLYLGGSGVTGTIPASLSNLESLTHIRLQHNPDLGGDLPAWVWNLDLNALDISYTSINVGETIPSQLQNHPRLQKLGLAGLGLSGEIPSWLGDMPFLRTDGTRDWHPYISLADNNLRGPIPASMGNLQTIDSLNLANNNLEGDIAMFANLGSPNEGAYLLGAFDVSGNPGLTGAIPSNMMNFYRMRVFRFDGTELCMPAGFDTFLASVLENGGRSSLTNRLMPYASVTDPETMQFCVTSSIDDDLELNPYIFRLNNNYPNPFNPTTNIVYQIPFDANVSLTVYNVMGQRVATLVDEYRPAGNHTVMFDARHLASGQYMYRLQVGEMSMTRKMTLVK
ncbi:MAG: T9SS C-terminal target domain-containing protein [Balneolaceae bacterium]|nr:MAG: T9SS C-terminal target domain-containing protein [Balneolaceae bacterium]